MKLDMNRIAELKARNEYLDERESKMIAELKAQGMSFNEWYSILKDELHEMNEEKQRNQTEMTVIKATNIEVGDGISLSPYSDWDAYTVIERRETPKGFVLTIQEDEAIRTDSNGMSDCQTYEFKRNTNGITRTVKWNAKKNWFTADGYKVALGRHSYYDYSF